MNGFALQSRQLYVDVLRGIQADPFSGTGDLESIGEEPDMYARTLDLVVPVNNRICDHLSDGSHRIVIDRSRPGTLVSWELADLHSLAQKLGGRLDLILEVSLAPQYLARRRSV